MTLCAATCAVLVCPRDVSMIDARRAAMARVRNATQRVSYPHQPQTQAETRCRGQGERRAGPDVETRSPPESGRFVRASKGRPGFELRRASYCGGDIKKKSVACTSLRGLGSAKRNHARCLGLRDLDLQPALRNPLPYAGLGASRAAVDRACCPTGGSGGLNPGLRIGFQSPRGMAHNALGVFLVCGLQVSRCGGR